MSETLDGSKLTATIPCPTCGKTLPVAEGRRPEGFPFCSRRCRDRDFGRWIDGAFVVAGETLSAEHDPYASEDGAGDANGDRR